LLLQTITDELGRKWTLLLKQWTANSAQAPRPIYVFERTSACMKAHKAAPGHILQAYITNSDPSILRMTVISPSGAEAAAAAAASSSPAAGEQRTVSPAVADLASTMPQQLPQRSNFDVLLSAATAYDMTTHTAPEAEAADAVINAATGAASRYPIHHDNYIVPNRNTTGSTISKTNPMPSNTVCPLPPSGTGAGYVVGICKRSSRCSKESGHSGFCSNFSSSSLRIDSAPKTMYANNTSTQANTRDIHKPIDYLGRREDRKSPADALNAAALQMQQRFSSQEVQGFPTPDAAPSHPHHSSTMALHLTGRNDSYCGKKKAPSRNRMSRKNPYGVAVNAPFYLNPASTKNTNTNTAAAAAAALASYKETRKSFPLARGGPVNSVGIKTPKEPPQKRDIHTTNNNYATSTTITDTPLYNNADNNDNPNPKEICPTWIVINYKNLRGDLHVPSLMVTLINTPHRQHPSKNGRAAGSTGPMSIKEFQLMAQTLHSGAIQFKKDNHRVPGSTARAATINGGRGIGGGGGGREERANGSGFGSGISINNSTGPGILRNVTGEGDTNTTIMVEGASMSLQRWLKGWDLPNNVLPESSPNSGAVNGVNADNEYRGGGYMETALQTPPGLGFPTYHRHSISNEPGTSKKRPVSRTTTNNNPGFVAASVATEFAIAAADASAGAAEEDKASSPMYSMKDDGSGSLDSDLEAGEVLLSMMGIIGGEKERKKDGQEQEQKREETRQQQQEQEVAVSLLTKPESIRITPRAAAQLYAMLVNERLESQLAASAAATARFLSTVTPVSSDIALQLQLRQEAIIRARARLHELSTRAKLSRILACLSHIKFPSMQY